ncbi:terminase large subunit [Acinetobacter bereziniae]|uniref:terminase large subunit n=1 Tax=Acinetobacter bereziniae TaxID=106648 RepID=UPI0021CD7A29|nr:terminase TerL endonuclease subunit [Acinetobacter bereziniae]MCU4539630.1 terminase large subunit [Acinetobacter bereziniae]MCU4624191.1 terminase large subunit [Acinetobacter bereziniae]
MRDYFKVALQYCQDVRSGVRVAGQLEKLAIKRFLSDLARSGFKSDQVDEETQSLLQNIKFKSKPDIDFEYELSLERVTHACKFVEACPHVKGKLAKVKPDGTRHKLILEPWQIFCMMNIFGWVDSENKRRFLYVYIEVAKKNGKSTWLAAVALYLAFIDGEMGAEVYTAATSRDQAKIVFEDAKKMVEFSPRMRSNFGIEFSLYSVYQTETNSTLKALSQDRGGTKDGLNVHAAIIDELHAHKTADMYDIVANGVAAREEPLILAITTAGDDTTTKCYQERQVVVDILRGKAVHDQYFGMVFCLDRGDDWQDPKVWPKANPNYGISVTEKYLHSVFEKVKVSPKQEGITRQKHLNEWVGAVDGWIAPSIWEAAKSEISESHFKGQVCFGGYDLASRLDLAGWGRLRPRLQDNKIHWHIFATPYINERVVDTKEAINGEKRPDEYPVWRDQGHLVVTPGASTDFDRIQQDIEKFHIENSFYELGHDPYHAAQLTSNLMDQGINVIEVPQTTQYLSEPMRWLEQLLAEGRLHHDGDPVLQWCVLNVVVRPDAKECIFPRKISPGKKIDLAIGMIIAASRAMYYDDESVFDLIPGEDDGNIDDWLDDMIKVAKR